MATSSIPGNKQALQINFKAEQNLFGFFRPAQGYFIQISHKIFPLSLDQLFAIHSFMIIILIRQEQSSV